ncbi:hypothetical protein OE88DRAFT_51544 [Heliocybe sulcata]|uniref:Uncharacterized protein n=1 Tax=Heliocybe sulcata TaxID=5364 RepID=A0A5C3NKS0_9AGAM|nr:hypothetical protein OE88DRAFT_51544 [Heliocybe sulcata]
MTRWAAMISLTGVMLVVVQAAHTLRLWYLSVSCKALRWALVLNFGVFLISEMIAVAYSAAACSAMAFPGMVDLYIATVVQQRVWLPAVILHAVLYAISAVRALQRRSSGTHHENMVRERIMFEGAAFFTALLGYLVFNTLGTFGSELLSIRANFSNFVPAIISVSMSRLMLSLRSLSTSLGTEPEWLLSHLELSRVNWTRGARSGELIVELGEIQMEDERVSQSSTATDPDIVHCVSEFPRSSLA